MSVTPVPLTTVFTPPASCTKSWTYEGEFYNSVPGGILIQNDLVGMLDTECFPPGFDGSGRAYNGQLFSPGACPELWTTAVSQGGATNTVICCSSGFSYFSTLSKVDHYSQTLVFKGCLSEFSGVTSLLARQENTDLNSTQLTGSMTMWGQPITIAFQENDASLFTTITSSTLSSTPSARAKPATPSETSSLSTTVSNSAPTATLAPAEPSSGLSTGTKAGIGVGASVGVLVLIIFGFIFGWRKRKRGQVAELPTNSYNSVPQWWNPHAVEIGGKEKPAEAFGERRMSAVELDTGNGSNSRTMSVARNEPVELG